MDYYSNVIRNSTNMNIRSIANFKYNVKALIEKKKKR